MSNSSLVTYKKIVSNKTPGRGGKKIDKIFLHHMAGSLTVKQCGNVFATRAASAHYGVIRQGLTAARRVLFRQECDETHSKMQSFMI